MIFKNPQSPLLLLGTLTLHLQRITITYGESHDRGESDERRESHSHIALQWSSRDQSYKYVTTLNIV